MSAVDFGSAGRLENRPDARVRGLPLAVLLLVASGPVAGLLAYGLTMQVTALAPALAAISGAAAQFAVADHLATRRRFPAAALLTACFIAHWALLFVATLALFATMAQSGAPSGTRLDLAMGLGLLAGPPLLAALLTIMPALAVGGGR